MLFSIITSKIHTKSAPKDTPYISDIWWMSGGWAASIDFSIGRDRPPPLIGGDPRGGGKGLMGG